MDTCPVSMHRSVPSAAAAIGVPAEEDEDVDGVSVPSSAGRFSSSLSPLLESVIMRLFSTTSLKHSAVVNCCEKRRAYVSSPTTWNVRSGWWMSCVTMPLKKERP